MGLMLGHRTGFGRAGQEGGVAQMMAQHIIINRTSETVLRFLPPYILERKHVDMAIAALDGILTAHFDQCGICRPAPAGEHITWVAKPS